MLNEKLIWLVCDTDELLGLDETVIEQDYYVTQIIHAHSQDTSGVCFYV